MMNDKKNEACIEESMTTVELRNSNEKYYIESVTVTDGTWE